VLVEYGLFALYDHIPPWYRLCSTCAAREKRSRCHPQAQGV
jgi:hypothetical protein